MDLNTVIEDSTQSSKDPLPGSDRDEDVNDIYPTLSEDDHEQMMEAQKTFNKDRSPMQEVVLLEQRWQGYVRKLDEILSNEDKYITQSSFYVIFSKEDTLSILFSLFDWENIRSVSQQKFVDCLRYSIRGSGSQEFIDLVDVLAFVICGESDDITENDFYRIFKSKGVLAKLYKLLSKDCDGLVTKKVIMDFIANLTYVRSRDRFTKENLEHLERMFRDMLGSKDELTFEDFKKIVNSRNSFFAERVFQVFDRDKNGSVSLNEFLDAMRQFTGKSSNEKLQFLFRIYDLDGDGIITKEELGQVMKACMEENGMTFSNEEIEDLTSALFEDADTDNTGEISFEELKIQITKHEGLMENLSISIDRWLIPPKSDAKDSQEYKSFLPYQLTLPYFKNNYVGILFLLFYIGINIGLFVDRAVYIVSLMKGYPAPDPSGNSTFLVEELPITYFYVLSRACGKCLDFNCAFILVLVLRRSLTFLRNNGASAFLPLDQSIYYHKMCGFVILAYSVVHTVMHICNFSTVIVYIYNPKGLSVAEWLFTSRPGAFGLVAGWANPTGMLLIVILIIMVICSLPFVRKSGSFQVFYWTHLLYVAFFILVILHAPAFWKWLIVPGVIFVIEKVYRFFQMNSGHRKTYVSSGILLPSKVIHLVIKKPPGFHYHPGDYVFANIPAIAKYEWHPFTISSAPEQDDAVWLHVRGVGQWTNRLYEYFEKEQQLHEKSPSHKMEILVKETPKIIIESLSSQEVSINIPDVKNGVVNASYEADKSETKEEETEKELSSDESEKGDTINEIGPSRPIRNRRDVSKTTSVPDLDKKTRKRENNQMIHDFLRINSEKTYDAKKSQEDKRISNISESETSFTLNRSVAQSFKYMRKKPKVVTLDLPEDDFEPEDEAPGDEEKVSTDPAINLERGTFRSNPKATVVRLASGRIFPSKKVKNIDEERRRSRRESRLKEAEGAGHRTVGKPLVIYLDGAYGSPSSHIFMAQHAVLIGTGIGVTPFASILQSIMHRYLRARQTCPNCSHAWTSEIPNSIMNLRKVDFFWINRNQRAFEWFVNLLSQLEIEQAEQGGIMERFLDMHMYITSALQKTDMKAVGLQLAMDLLHEKEKRDLITGLKTRTNAGRPNWDKVFKQLSNQKKGKITMFYCGPPTLARILRRKCIEYGFEFRKEVF